MRLAILHSLIVAAAFGAAAFGARVVTRDSARKLEFESIQAEAKALLAEDRAEGAVALRKDIERRRADRSGIYYRLLSSSDVVLVDDLPGARLTPGWTKLDWDKPDDDAPLRRIRADIDVWTQRTASGALLSVGGTRDFEERLRENLLNGILWIGAAAALVALSASAYLTLRTLRRVDRLASIAQGAVSGRFDRRLPAPAKGGDDLDIIARALNRMLDDFVVVLADHRGVASAIAHDLRTPLTRLAQRLARIDSTRLPGAEGSELGLARSDLDETLRLIDTMLRLAEIEAVTDQGLHCVDLAEVAARVADAYRPDIEESGRTLAVNLDRAIAKGDGALLSQAVANLLENAIDHTPSDSAVRVETGANAAGAYLVVADNGVGVPFDERKSVLKRFSKLEASRSKKGFGLGLAIVAAIARRHHAEVDLSDESPGLRVSMRFPSPS